MYILSIETSCDETSCAVLELTATRAKLRAHQVLSQVKDHAPYGGVVPELAARRHAENIIPLLHRTLSKARTTPAKLDLLAVTQGPGLITALQIGVETARTLAYGWGKPLIGVNHIAGHLVSPFLDNPGWKLMRTARTWPAVALVVSGGHTELYLMRSPLVWKLLGKTVDDAVGEAFDKVGKLLALPYPGGPRVSKLADIGLPDAYKYPRPMLTSSNLNFSFAGLKTAVRYSIEGKKLSHQHKADVCASFQRASVDVLVHKTVAAAQATQARTIMLSGGVSANLLLRKELGQAATEIGCKFLPVNQNYTGDNAAMIALAGGLEANKRGLNRYRHGWQKIRANANWELWQVA